MAVCARGSVLVCYAVFAGEFFSTFFWGGGESGRFSGSGTDDHQLIFFIWPYKPQCQHSTTDLARDIMVNERKQSALSKARSSFQTFQNYMQVFCIQFINLFFT